MDGKQRHREEPGKGNNEQKRFSSTPTTTITAYDLTALKDVIYGYLGFLRNVNELGSRETLARLQAVYDRLPEKPPSDDAVYFSHEELIAILEAIIGFKVLLVTVFPHTVERDIALDGVERLYQRLVNARSLPLN